MPCFYLLDGPRGKVSYFGQFFLCELSGMALTTDILAQGY
jgi:hypothetical protein